VSPVLIFLFFEDFLRGPSGGAAEQLAIATAEAFLSTPAWRERKAVSAPSYENT
jgi:hypothetical protein